MGWFALDNSLLGKMTPKREVMEENKMGLIEVLIPQMIALPYPSIWSLRSLTVLEVWWELSMTILQEGSVRQKTE